MRSLIRLKITKAYKNLKKSALELQEAVTNFNYVLEDIPSTSTKRAASRKPHSTVNN